MLWKSGFSTHLLMSMRYNARFRLLKGNDFTRFRSTVSAGLLTSLSFQRKFTWGDHSISSSLSVSLHLLQTTGTTSKLATSKNRNTWQRISSLTAWSKVGIIIIKPTDCIRRRAYACTFRRVLHSPENISAVKSNDSKSAEKSNWRWWMLQQGVEKASVEYSEPGLPDSGIIVRCNRIPPPVSTQ